MLTRGNKSTTKAHSKTKNVIVFDSDSQYESDCDFDSDESLDSEGDGLAGYLVEGIPEVEGEDDVLAADS